MGFSRLKSAIVVLVAVLGLVSVANAALKDDIQERIKPVGEVCLMGDACAGDAMAAAGGEAMGPDQVYQTYCNACHGTGLNNAPKFGDAAAWAPRVEKGMDILYSSAVNGFNNGLMPAKGTCMSCSDEDLQATVDYMLENSQ